MSLKEKVAYLKGLAEGLGLDAESKEGKLIAIIIDTLADMSDELEILSENAIDVEDELDAISENLADVVEYLFDDDDDYDDFDDDDDFEHECACGHCHGHGDDGFTYEAECPACGEEIVIDESDLIHGSATCAGCGEVLEFEFGDDGDEDGDIVEVE